MIRNAGAQFYNKLGKILKLDPKKTLFLIDGSSFLYRAYYGTRPLHTSKGLPVNAVYSFCRMIKKLADKFSPHYISLVWDSKGPTTRHELYEAYKATRQAPPSDLFDQKDLIQKFADLIKLHQFDTSGYEADDLMYAIAKEQIPQGKDIVFITSDKDMGQALSLNTPQASVLLYDAFKDELVDKEQLEKKLEFPVERLPMYFALLGDSSDNIPGVYGIGKKGATELVQQFSSLEDLYARIDEVKKPKMRSALEANRDNAFLSRGLFLLQYVPTGLSLEDFKFDSSHWINAFSLFRELEFKSLLQVLVLTKEQQEDVFNEKIERLRSYNFKAVTTPIELANLVVELQTKKACAIDTETDGLRPLEDNLVGISFCTQEGSAYYIPCGHKGGEAQLSLDEIRAALNPVFQDKTIKKYLHNAKFDMLVLAAHAMPLEGVAFDSLIAANLVTKDWQRISLKQLSIYYFDESMVTFDEVVKEKKLKDFSYVPLEYATLYASFDAHQTFRLYKIFEEALKEEHMDILFYEIEFPLLFVLYEMEKKGIFVDPSILEKLNGAVTEALAKIEQDILAMLGSDQQTINLNSPKQVEKLLFQDLNLPPQKKSTKRTGYSTDQEVLEALSQLHPVPALILKYRELFKLKTTYLEGLPRYINPRDSRIHSTFSQTRVATGRLSSYDPNMQNIPSSGAGLVMRRAFKPDSGHLFISADYSQIELRVLAYLSQDQNLIAAFQSGKDIHKETAARLFDIPLDKVTNAQRQVGKRINFSILYGLTPYGLSKDLNIPFKDAKIYIDKYFAQYPGVQKWMDTIVKEATDKGYVTTHWGRRRYIPAIYEKNRVLYEEAKRVAINTVAQGTAAEIMKRGMIALDKKLKQELVDAHMILQIHDELLICVSPEQQEKAAQLIQQSLEKVVDWDVPLEVTVRSGTDWKEVSK